MRLDHFIAFAYGSNMPAARLQEPCPSARPVGVAELRGYELRWHKKSKDGSGKSDIVATDRPGASVFGVHYKVLSSERAGLDRAEGLGSGYDETDIEVHRGPDQLTAKAYAAAIDPLLKPYTWYRDLTIAGAREHGLPPDYIAGLESVSAEKDPDEKRHNTHVALFAKVTT
ncbi:gamma-glutamylcyclotransferase family protein [Rhizobium ruizarguesonis]